MRRLVPLLHATLLLLFVPPLAQPFSAPKLAALLAGAVLALLLLRPAGPGTRALPMSRHAGPGASLWPLAWLLLAGASALAHPSALQPLLLDGGAALLLFALLTRQWDSRAALRALAWLGCLEALIVLAQHGPRMARFGTLGNPDFAAAWLGASLCLAIGEGMTAAALLQGAALCALGSLASVLALAAACVVALPRKRWALPLLAALCLGAASGRAFDERLAGRRYLHRVAAAHLLDAPLLGLGPGAVRAHWPAWEAALFREEDRRFAAPQDHVHDDLLERALEQGIPAALLFAACAGLAIARGRRRTPWAAAALASLCARALVDFPLARPAELALFVTLAAACLEVPCTESLPSPQRSSLPPPPPARSPEPAIASG